MIAKIDEIDKRLSSKIHNSDPSWLFGYFLLLFGSIYDPLIVPFTFVFVAVLGEVSNSPNRHMISALYGISFAVMFLLSTIMKKGFRRVRPTFPPNSQKSKWLRHKQKNFSMPSGDSLQGWHLATFCLLHFQSWWMIVVGILISYSRVHFVCHWIGDVITGAAFGVTGCLALQTILAYGLNLIEEHCIVKPFWL